MIKEIKLENLGCANCGEKMVVKIKKIQVIKNASLNFVFEKIIIETKEELNDQEYNELLIQIKKIIKKIEPQCNVEV